MSIEVAVFQHLANNVPSVNNRVYALVAPQGAGSPYIVINKVSGVRDYTMQGESAVVTARYQFTVYALGYAAAKATTKEIQAAFSGFKGQMGGAGGAWVEGCFYQNEIDGFDTSLSASGYYQVITDYLIKHYE